MYDADLVASMPPELSVASGLNAVAHCVDALWGPHADPIDAALAAEGLRALNDGLRSGDTDGASRPCTAATLPRSRSPRPAPGCTTRSATCSAAAFDLPHAAMHAIVLPYVVAFNAPAAPDAAARIAAALGSIDALATGCRTCASDLDAPRALRDIGLRAEDLPEAVEVVLPAVPPNNPRPVDAAALTRLLRAAWRRGRPGRGSCMTGMSEPGRAREQELSEAVVASFAGTPDERLRTLMTALIRHLHAFVREVRLTEPEWAAAIGFLTAAGHVTDDRRQEFILLSDVLGASMQTITINDDGRRATRPRPPCSARSSSRTSPDDRAGRRHRLRRVRASRAGSRDRSGTSTVGRFPARGWRSGRPTTTASTTSSTPTAGPPRAATSSPTATASSVSGR